MGKRALQVIAFALLGALIALWLADDDADAPPIPTSPTPRPTVRVEQLPPVQSSQQGDGGFRLPPMPAPLPEPRSSSLPEQDPLFAIPRNWDLRGSAARNYELRSDRRAFAGNYSAVLSSHTKDIQPNLTGSAVQAIVATPYAGTRLEFSASLMSDEPRGETGSIWVYVTDPARVVIAYQAARTGPSQVPGQWQRYRVVLDVPWHAEVIAYGFSLQGKGKLWADDIKLTPVDTNVPITGRENNHQLGVIAQAVSLDGALANPNNLDFEDIQMTRERQPQAPPDELKGTRF
jgi:hypothetical protein